MVRGPYTSVRRGELDPRHDRSVYRLLYPCDTAEWPAKTPFYIGKGGTKRPEDHLRGAKIHLGDADFERQANREKNLFKLRVIRKILKSGHTPLIEYVALDITTVEANAIEISEIARIGRRDLGRGPLTNLTDGGEGTRGYKRPEEVKERDREREADPDLKELQRIQQRALQRFPEIKQRQRDGVRRGQLDMVRRFKAARDLIAPRVLHLREKGLTIEEIRVQLDLYHGVVPRILKENGLTTQCAFTRKNLKKLI